MQDATAGSQDAPIAGYSLQEAAALLGIGINTLRRRIAAGQIRATQVQRPQGYVWRVYLDGRHPPAQPANDPPIQEATGSLPQPPGPIAQAEALASLIQATLTPIIAPLVGELAASRQTVERLAGDLREVEREVGELRAENRALLASTAPEPVEPTTEPPVSRWHAWGAGALMVLTIVALVVLLAWPR